VSRLVERPTQCVPEIAESPLDLLKLGEEPHGVLPVEGLGPRRQHRQGSAEIFKFLIAVHGKRTYVRYPSSARGKTTT